MRLMTFVPLPKSIMSNWCMLQSEHVSIHHFWRTLNSRWTKLKSGDVLIAMLGAAPAVSSPVCLSFQVVFPLVCQVIQETFQAD